MSRIWRLFGDVFWSAMIVLGLLIVAYFILRTLGKFGLSPITSRVATLATPSGS